MHAWLGRNEIHDELSLYSFGWLRKGRVRQGRLDFPGGTTWTVSFVDPALGKRLLNGVLDDPDVTCGMRVSEVQLAEAPEFGASQRFLIDGAVLTRRNRDDGGRDHLTFADEGADETLTRTLRSKLAAAGLDASAHQVRVRFDREWPGAKSKVVTLKGVTYKTSVCPVIVEGTPEAVRFAWLAGAGELTGSGLGALR
ncbi:MAG: CRISPR-associated endoribonuclease Cas6 [Bacteroidota bacterium]